MSILSTCTVHYSYFCILSDVHTNFKPPRKGQTGCGDGQESDVLCITFVTATADIWRLADICPWVPWKALRKWNALLHTQCVLQGDESDPNLGMFVSSSLFLCKILIKRLWNQIEAYTRKRVLFFFGAEARWVFWWRQMVEGREGWLKNQVQHIHPLAVEQDTPGTPRGRPLWLIYASTPHPHCFSLKFLFSTVLSLFPPPFPLLWYFVIFCTSTVRSSGASREIC